MYLSLLINSILHAADAAVAKLGKATGHPERLAALAVDISDPKSIEAATQTLERDFAGKLGGLINNAAVRSSSVSCLFSCCLHRGSHTSICCSASLWASSPAHR